MTLRCIFGHLWAGIRHERVGLDIYEYREVCKRCGKIRINKC